MVGRNPGVLGGRCRAGHVRDRQSGRSRAGSNLRPARHRRCTGGACGDPAASIQPAHRGWRRRRVLREVKGGSPPFQTPPSIDPRRPASTARRADPLRPALLPGRLRRSPSTTAAFGAATCTRPALRDPVLGDRGATREAGRQRGQADALDHRPERSRPASSGVAPLGCCSIGVHVSAASRHRCGDDRRLVRLRHGRGVLRLRRPPQRARPARQHLLELRLRGERQRPHRRRGGGGGTSLYPNGPAAAYYPQPEFISSRGYGFLLDQPSWLASSSTTSTRSPGTSPPPRRGCATSSRPGSGPQAIRSADRDHRPAAGTTPLGRWARCSTGWSRTSARPTEDYQSNVQADLDNIARYACP